MQNNTRNFLRQAQCVRLAGTGGRRSVAPGFILDANDREALYGVTVGAEPVDDPAPTEALTNVRFSPLEQRSRKTDLDSISTVAYDLWGANGTDKLMSTSDRTPADRRFTEPLRFSKTQEPVAGNIDNDWPISDAGPS